MQKSVASLASMFRICARFVLEGFVEIFAWEEQRVERCMSWGEVAF